MSQIIESSLRDGPPPSPDEATAVLKAINRQLNGGRVSGERPKAVAHLVYDGHRRRNHLSNGIIEDLSGSLSPRILRTLADRNIAIQAVIHTIKNQVAAHFRRPENARSIGCKVVQKDRKRALTKATAKRIEEITDILFIGGIRTNHPRTGEPGVWDGHGKDRADPLDTTVRKIIQDSLVLDRAFVAVEGSMSKKNPVMYFKHVDGGLIRETDADVYIPQIRTGSNGSDDLTGRVKYVQFDTDAWAGRVEREYAWDEGHLSFRNPGVRLESFGQGISEVQHCLGAVTGFLHAMKANEDWFQDNHVPPGILSVFGSFDREGLDSIQQMLAGDIGVGGSIWRVPILASPPQQGSSVAWTPLQDRSRMDMVSKTYLELCVALVAAVFQIAPEEFGFRGFGGPESTLQQGSQEDTLQHSQHKGLLPKVLWMARFLSEGVVSLIDEDFEVVVQGLEAAFNPEQMIQLQVEMSMMQAGKTINDIAAMNDEPPVVDPLDDELWEEIKSKHADQWYESEKSRIDAMTDEYKAAGGKLGDYPNAPVMCPGAMQIWAQQHMQQGQDTQDQMAGMADQASSAQMQGDMAERQGVQGDMQNQLAMEQEYQQGDRMAQADADRNNELRLPMSPDALNGIRKAIRVYRVGARDA